MDKKILRDLNYGVYVIGGKFDSKNFGCIANSVMQITSDPVTIAISINHENFTNHGIKESGKFSISILNEESDPEIIGTFGFSSSREQEKFKKFDFGEIDGLPVIKDSNGYILCENIGTFETQTHTIFLGKMIECEKFSEKSPMSYKFYQEKLKGKSPKNAPTYQQEILEEIKSSRWQCLVCGYVYEGNMLPLDFKCPICKQPREFFEKLVE